MIQKNNSNNYEQAEIIILPIEDSIKKNNTAAFIERFAGSIADFPEIDALPLSEKDEL